MTSINIYQYKENSRFKKINALLPCKNTMRTYIHFIRLKFAYQKYNLNVNTIIDINNINFNFNFNNLF